MAPPPPPPPQQHHSASRAPNKREPTLMEEMVESMALSMLVFLYADVRLMSQTGRISLPFEWIAVDSDYVPRYTKAQLAGLTEDQERHEEDDYGSKTRSDTQPASSPVSPRRSIPPECQNEGLSTCQIMACLLLELQKHVKKTREVKKNGGKLSSSLQSSPAMDQHDKFVDFDASSKTAQGDGMHSLLRAYAEMVGSDLNHTVPHIEARRSVLNLGHASSSRSFVPFASHRKHHQSEAGGSNSTGPGPSFAAVAEELEEEEKGEDEDVTGDSGTRAASADMSDVKATSSGLSSVPEDSERLDDAGNDGDTMPTYEFGNRAARRISWMQSQMNLQDANPLTVSKQQRIRGQVKAMHIMNEEERTNLHFEEVTDALFNMGKSSRDLRQSVALATGSTDRISLTSEQLTTVMEKAVESRLYHKLDFVASFFREGTVSQLMAKSRVKIVWFNDWFPLKDLTYAIAVDTAKKRVIVVFRGAITKQDWNKAFDFKIREVKNPITEDFPGRPERVGIYSGFYKYLFRRRQDTGTTKYDEIASLAHKYGMERIGAEYTLQVCGHSLGAALSTVFSFHASCEERFVNYGPVKVCSFGSPYIGNHAFADAWRHQEMSRRLQYARFSNHNDIFAHIPDNLLPTSRGSKFRHVGIGVRVKPVPRIFKRFRRWKPRVSYVGAEGSCSSYFRGLGNFALFHTTWPWQMSKMHTLAELQARVMNGAEREDDRTFEYMNKSLSQIYEKLSDINFRTAEG